MPTPTKLAICLVALVLVAAGAVAAIMLGGRADGGHSTRAQSVQPPKPAPPQRPVELATAWTTYGFDSERTHVAPRARLRPPFRRLWAVHDPTFFEFPPVVSNGRLYIGSHGGRVLALEAATGKVLWQRTFRGCIAASAAVAGRLVYFGLMGRLPCDENAGGGVVALDAATGRLRWRADTGVVEASPLVVDGVVYVGSWDHNVYALDARTGHVRWRFETGGRVKAGAAWAHHTVYIGSYDGKMYALEDRIGRLRWAAPGGNFYATPSLAYGKAYAGATDGVMYAYDVRTGDLAWSTPTSSFVYAAAAVWRGTVYVGSYDHRFYALDALTGRRRWSRDFRHPISGAPTVLDGLVYLSTCGSCSQYESDPAARRTYALDARSGRLVWSFPDGEYSPVVTDSRRVYLTGFTTLYGLAAARTAASS